MTKFKQSQELEIILDASTRTPQNQMSPQADWSL